MDIKRIHVFVAEPEALIAFHIEALLKQMGHVVLPLVSTVADALTVLATARPHIALLNVTLGDGSAVPVAHALIAAGVPFATMLGRDMDGLDHPVFHTAPHLAKPFDHSDVRMIVKRLRALG